ncbi:chaperonin 10-like protein [Kalaharituber pfeilii]|nr:chaperonin 10-like protein [Kalaharituber pfeilii]
MGLLGYSWSCYFPIRNSGLLMVGCQGYHPSISSLPARVLTQLFIASLPLPRSYTNHLDRQPAYSSQKTERLYFLQKVEKMTISTTMKAVKVVGKGVPPEIREVPVPQLSPNSVLIKVKAIALNPTDWKHIDLFPKKGATVGCDCSGEIIAVNPEETRWKVGDRVAAFGHGCCHTDLEAGCFGEYACVSTHPLIKLPDHIPWAEGASLPVIVHTAAQGLYMEQNGLNLPFPTVPTSTPFPILIYGGATGCGMGAIQFAKLSGLKVVTTSSPKNFKLLKSFGADEVIDYRDPDLVEKIKAATDNNLHHAFDCISDTTTIKHCNDSFGPGPGFLTVVTIGADVSAVRPDIKMHAVLIYSAMGRKYLFLDGVRDINPYEVALAEKFSAIVTKLLTRGNFRPVPISLLPGGLQGVPVAIDKLRNGEYSAEKLVLEL